MIDIGTTEFYFAVPSLSRPELEQYSLQLFDRWEMSVADNLVIPDYSLSLEVENGSIKGQGRIAVVLGALYFGIGNYGSFISGLQTIKGQVAVVSDFFVETAKQQLGTNFGTVKVRKRSGTLGSLQRLFVRIQRGEITPAEATKEAEKLIGDDSQESPDFMSSLSQSLAQTPRFHEQTQLPLEDADGTLTDSQPGKERLPRRPSAPPWPIPTHLRVEVWRESKKQQKNFRIVKV